MDRKERLKVRRLARSTQAPHALIQRARAILLLRVGLGPIEVSLGLIRFGGHLSKEVRVFHGVWKEAAEAFG
jgi:hypothetical protein